MQQSRLQRLDLSGCSGLRELPAGLGELTGLQTLNLSRCKGLRELPAGLGALTGLQTLDLRGCDTLHTPPPHVVRAGTAAVLQFLRDLAKGDVPCHLVKLVLLGDQCAGKSSLADSLVLGRPATRRDDDRTVGIDVRGWWLGGGSPVVVNIYDAAGQRVYRASHGLFMSEGALFLHVVRGDASEDAAVEALLEWVEAVQQEAPGAAMGVVWTHRDRFVDGVCDCGSGFLCGYLCTTDIEEATTVAMRYLQRTGPAVQIKDTSVVFVDLNHDVDEKTGGITRSVSGLVAMVDLSQTFTSNLPKTLRRFVAELYYQSPVAVIAVVGQDVFDASDEERTLLLALTPLPSIPVMLIKTGTADALARTGARVSSFPGARTACLLRHVLHRRLSVRAAAAFLLICRTSSDSAWVCRGEKRRGCVEAGASAGAVARGDCAAGGGRRRGSARRGG